MAKANKRKQAQAQRGATMVVNDDFRQLIGERLLDGADPEELAQQLAAGGVPLALVQAEILRALKSPYLRAAERLAHRLDKWEWVLQNRARLAANDPHGMEIPVLERTDAAQFYRDHYRAHRPAVIRGLFDHWAAREKWSLDYFAQTLGSREVRVQWNREADQDYEGNAGAHGAFRPFDELARLLASPEPSNDFYVTANNSDQNRQVFAPFYRDIGEMPELLHEGGAQHGFIWIGPKGTITPWHHDLTNNLLIQMTGRKRVRMVASHDTPLMRNHRHCFSSWKTDELLPGPAAEGRPAVLECEIGPGDAVFLPIGWWHHVEGLEQHIGMSFTGFAWDNDFYSSYHSFHDM
ncbi:cupin-like domain-containing protein [Sphingomonas sp. AOB5]|uniref:cupin-like domain-containing protein n=1 Tax=Sphingomonas sp. AOB5 TaxID=3034017 RepID=UPI0023F87035|nr:cupin-like domain-containing protein [Sphingomonas sp. AOB5]MDF7777152.1 cupin-like domain-containing protein [Sphingomonas sp. AOB5]